MGHSASAVQRYLRSDQTPLKPISDSPPRFLAAGEYNENHLVETAHGPAVLRINHGSQLGLPPGRQIAYEYAALTAAAPSGVTPRPLALDAHAPLGHGVLFMEYLPGRPLDYTTDSFGDASATRDTGVTGAAQVFGRIHSLPAPDGLIRQPDPIAAIAAESLGMIRRYPDHDLTRTRDRLLRHHADILTLSETWGPVFAAERQVLVNTEVNSGNFLVHEGRVRLTDWEKAVVSTRWQDIGHFLVPTTTLWKTDFTFSPQARRGFLAAYLAACAACDPDPAELPPLAEAERRCAVMERVILLRALSWCFMAHHEYTRPGRILTHDFTFGRITRYLDDIECFLS